MSFSKSSTAFLVVTLVLSIAFLQASPHPAVLALTGEPPSYTPGDTWKYQLTITNTTDGTNVSTTMTLSVSGYGNIEDFNGTSKTCYTLKYQPALDIFSSLFLYIVFYGEFRIFNGSIIEFIETLKEKSFSEFYVTKSGYELIGTRIYTYYFNGSYGIDLDVTMKLNESYPYPLKFPLEENSTFGYYTDAINCSPAGHFRYYNATTGNWDEVPLGPISLEGEFVFLLFPLLNVTGTENLTVPAGTLECWKMEYPDYPDVLRIWYSPEAEGIARINMSVEDIIIVSVDLQSYHHALLTPEQQALLLFSLLQYLSSQQFTLFIAVGGVAAALVVATLGILAWKRRK